MPGVQVVEKEPLMLTDRFQAWAPWILALLRIFAGVMFALHGAQKLFGFLGAMPPGVPWEVTYVAGSIEFFGGILLTIGLFTRFTAFICSGLMAVAYFRGHAGNGSFFPTVNGGEVAVLYCWLYLYIAAAGPGAFALDNLWRRRKVARA